ncbi:MAG TPA: hypothetical protein VH062_10760 [Polyangiaceae bacterium]|jgi:hypothetical protein|nr:hypothetical protein [Polyangiaceae bacterium]
MAIAEGNVYWSDGGAGGPVIERCAASACAATRSTLAAARPYEMVADAKDVYWVDGGSTVNACSIVGCSTLRTLGDPADDVVLSGGLAIDADNVYWAKSHFTIVSCPKSGCAGAPRVVLANLPYSGSEGIRPLVVAGDSLYFASVVQVSSGLDGKLFRCAKTGCDAPTVLASGLVNPSSLGTDGTTLYFSEHPDPCCTTQDTTCCQDRNVSRIALCAATGCNGMPTVLVPGASAASNISADPHHVFWATSDDSGTTGTIHVIDH